MNQNQAKFSITSIINEIIKANNNIECSGLNGSEKAYLISKLYNKVKKNITVIVSTAKEAENLSDNLCFFHKRPNIINFPAYNITPFKSLSYRSETSAQRIKALYNMLNSSKHFIAIIPIDALLQRVIPKNELTGFAELILPNEEINRDTLINKLISGGYSRSLIVEEAGDYCVRGDIIDIYSPQYDNPVRIEFFGDTVDSLRFFSPVTQRTLKEIDETVILPASETIIRRDSLEDIILKMTERMNAQQFSIHAIGSAIERIREQKNFSDIENLLSIIYKDTSSLFDYLDDNTIFICDNKTLKDNAASFQEEILKGYETACEEKRLCVEPYELYIQWQDCEKLLTARKVVNYGILPLEYKPDTTAYFNFDITDNTIIKGALRDFHSKDNLLKPLADWIIEKRDSGCSVLIICSTDIQANRIKSLMSPYGVGFEFINDFSESLNKKNTAFLCRGYISSGFYWESEQIALITEDEIFGPKRRRKRTSKEYSAKTAFLSFDDLKKDDFVVHTEHGIGKYFGLVKLKIEALENDFLVIEYKDADRLYVPVDRISNLQKYIGVEGISPAIDKMGGASWEKVKREIKKSAEKIAGELVQIYAARKVNEGYSFGEPDSGFDDFEAGFPYEETPDQIKAINDVIADMQSETPMDRLVCGDIGYGKTEVALRASFVAVNDGKQAAILVPTTILAQQHYETFKERFAKYPINVACLNRFKILKEQRKIISDLKDGKIDIIIGTHRLLQKDIAFKDLRLLIIDEEQRFGVKHKELFKKMRNTIDVLALTATPIPRTLHLSLMGIRDISVISTEPEGRKAIVTYVSEFEDVIAEQAIKNELARGGQIFFVHNNIEKIFSIADHLKKLVPEVRLGVAHGRLDKDELEKVMMRFISKEIDMLVCTTIIESGLDISSANTIIINRADRFGLSQIYQLRGRVGRSQEQAYAYLFVPQESNLTRDAKRRLKVLMEHTELGAGFQIAMNDLQIRGGGTILGASQSGKIAAVGYEMFLRLMEEAISEIKGEPIVERLEPEININISAFIPDSYIEDIEQRLSAYRKLSGMSELKELSDFKSELEDRYGKLPETCKNLFVKIMLKVLAAKAFIKRLDLSEQDITIHFSENHFDKLKGLIDMVVSYPNRFHFGGNYILKAKLLKKNGAYIAEVKNILKEIAQHVKPN